MLSPDEDFSQIGVNSGIKYAESFKTYKEILTADRDSPTFERIFSEFNTSLFGTAPPLSGDLVADDGDYDSELEKFRNELRAGSPIDDVADVRTGKASPPSLPIPSVQPDHHVSISVTSHVSHTITASPQVSNVVNNSVILPSEREVDNPPPSPPKATRPTARKKGSKSSKPTEVTTATAETDPASTTLKKRSQRAKAMPVETTTRTRSSRA